MKKEYIRPALTTHNVAFEGIICNSMSVNSGSDSYVTDKSQVLSGKTEWKNSIWDEADN